VTARILGFYNQSLLSSRSMVRIHQGAFQSGPAIEAGQLGGAAVQHHPDPPAGW
jgi:hypothetical protein